MKVDARTAESKHPETARTACDAPFSGVFHGQDCKPYRPHPCPYSSDKKYGCLPTCFALTCLTCWTSLICWTCLTCLPAWGSLFRPGKPAPRLGESQTTSCSEHSVWSTSFSTERSKPDNGRATRFAFPKKAKQGGSPLPSQIFPAQDRLIPERRPLQGSGGTAGVSLRRG